MKTKCPKCDAIIYRKISNYRYKESGLDNVYLEGTPVYECPCGISFASIFRVPRLNELIGKELVRKLASLRGIEIRFLRKNIYLSSKAFASKLGVGKTTLSKWENEVQNHSEAFDRLIRLTYMIEKGLKHQEVAKTLELLENRRLEKPENDYVIIAERTEDDYNVSCTPILGSKSGEFPFVLVSSGEDLAATNLQITIGDELRVESQVKFASTEVLPTSTSPSFLIWEVYKDASQEAKI